jgi:sialidase-1
MATLFLILGRTTVKTRYFSLNNLALAMSFLTMPLIAAEKPVEGPIDAFRGEAKFDIQQLVTRVMPGERSGGRFPNLVVATDGTVLATWGATGGEGDWWKRGLQVRRSEDGGKTWGEPITIANPGWQAGGLTVDETTGDVLAFVEGKYVGNDPDGVKPTIYRSTDHGKTWKAYKSVIHPDKNGNVPSMCMAEHGITLRHGKNKSRLLRPARDYAGGDRRAEWHKMYTNAIYSDDSGKMWKTSDPFPAMGTGEGTVAELADGRIYYNTRRHWEPKGSDSSMRWEAFSDDGGVTWKNLAVSNVLPDGPQGPGLNGCHAGLMRLPITGRDILIYSNCDSPNQERKNITVWASFDGAKTWPIKRSVYAGLSAYSSLTAGRPGTPSEGWIYAGLEGGKEHRYAGILLARFTLSWLLKGEKTGNGTLPDWVNP